MKPPKQCKECVKVHHSEGDFCSAACRAAHWRARNQVAPITDITDPETRIQAKRMADDAVAARREGCVRATVDARHPVRHGLDAERDARRGSCRVRLDWETFELLTQLAASVGCSRSEFVAGRIRAFNGQESRLPVEGLR